MKQKLIKSPFFNVEIEKHILTDTVTGKKFKVSKDIIEFALSYDSNTKYSQENELIINELFSINFLLKESDKNKITFQLKLQNDSIFGFQSYKHEEERNIVFIGIPFGGGNYTSNDTRKFPDIFRKMCSARNLRFDKTKNLNNDFLSNFSEYCKKNISKNIDNNLVKDAGNIYVHEYETRKDIYEKIQIISENFFKNKDIPFFIGGDHSITYPIIKAACSSYDEINVIHFDAHTDTYNSLYNELLDMNKLHHHGNFVSKILELKEIKKYYQFGIRGMVNSTGSTNNKVIQFWSDSIKKNIEEINLPQKGNYYITFDIDILDHAFAPGTATPVPNGLNVIDIYNLFEQHLKDKSIIGIDFVEVSPSKDINNITSSLAIELIFKLFSYIKL